MQALPQDLMRCRGLVRDLGPKQKLDAGSHADLLRMDLEQVPQENSYRDPAKGSRASSRDPVCRDLGSCQVLSGKLVQRPWQRIPSQFPHNIHGALGKGLVPLLLRELLQ